MGCSLFLCVDFPKRRPLTTRPYRSGRILQALTSALPWPKHHNSTSALLSRIFSRSRVSPPRLRWGGSVQAHVPKSQAAGRRVWNTRAARPPSLPLQLELGTNWLEKKAFLEINRPPRMHSRVQTNCNGPHFSDARAAHLEVETLGK